MSGASTVPAVLAALVQTVETALPGMQVFDGPPYGATLNPEFVCIGWDGDHSPGIALRQALNDAAVQSFQERYDIGSRIVVRSGDRDNSATVRTRCYQILDSIQDTLRTNAKPGGSALTQITASDYMPDMTPKGPCGELHFTISVLAWK